MSQICDINYHNIKFAIIVNTKDNIFMNLVTAVSITAGFLTQYFAKIIIGFYYKRSNASLIAETLKHYEQDIDGAVADDIVNSLPNSSQPEFDVMLKSLDDHGLPNITRVLIAYIVTYIYQYLEDTQITNISNNDKMTEDELQAVISRGLLAAKVHLDRLSLQNDHQYN